MIHWITDLANHSLLLILNESSQEFRQEAPPATPIDGGLSLLLAACGVYGFKKIKDKRK
ncbi:MAG: hypothetical protein AAFQ94_11000 [Bacteroidota bacterium]